MYFGRHQLGEELRLQVVCRNGSLIAVNPDSAPVVDIYQGSTPIALGLPMFPTNRYFIVGLFLLPYKLANLSSGTYNLVFRWKTGSFQGRAVGCFEIVDGGSSQGNCLSMIYYNPPGGQFLVRQTDAGKLFQGKNPQ